MNLRLHGYTRNGIAWRICILAALWAPTAAHSLTCGDRQHTLSEAYESADSIIVGLITDCLDEESGEHWVNGGAGCSFIDLEVLKESTPTRDYSGLASSTACGLSLRAGNQYLLFLDSNNQPMRYSEPLDRDDSVAENYLRILRDFKNGGVHQLAEPWMFRKIDGYCLSLHRIGDLQLIFKIAGPNARQRPTPDWTTAMDGDEATHSAVVPTYFVDSNSPVGETKMTVFGNMPDLSDDALQLSVRFQESSPAPAREVSVSVGERAWLLSRMEVQIAFFDMGKVTHIHYVAGGAAAEAMLSAMMQPTDVIVSAPVVQSSGGSALYSTSSKPRGGDIHIVSRGMQVSNIIQRLRRCSGKSLE